MKKESVVKNDEKMCRDIEKHLLASGFGEFDFDTWSDDGSVGVKVASDDHERTYQAAKLIDEKFGHMRVGDGVQEGDLWISSVDGAVSGVVSDIARKADY